LNKGSCKDEPNTVFAKYTNNKSKELHEVEYIVMKYDRLTNEVEVIHMGGTHLPVYFDFSTPEKLSNI